MLGVELVVGVLAGLLLGAILYLFPPLKKPPDEISQKRIFIVILFLSIFFVLGAARLDARGAGPLSALLFAVVIGRKNAELSASLEVWFKQLWLLLMPFLFGLIGYEVDVTVVLNLRALLCVCIIFVGLIFRVIASYFSCLGSGLDWKERLFVAIAWSPKATVQAAIGSVPLETVQYVELDC